ncbi:helix-turn-helix domain-containing protein [uncultured Alistipes sp.]|uniref:helix-turn-helix domain-containing protein n=1 Tax=uncultured Alistipes sp. TaxID=538949 RepID=UPI00272B8A14|nr:helix-turn-helix domain-containing protein [uncultured Alistipes sp.]
MEIITFDHEVYKDLSEKIERIANYVFKKAAQPQHIPEIWLTNEELADLLKISTRTLQRLRKERVIPYTMVRSKCLYRLSDVEECISRRIVTCTPQTLDEFRKSYYLTHKSPAL